MALTLKLGRDITRFIDDETFPFKATVCIGEKRIVCSGVVLAEHSHALEMKMREDNGILLFEEMVDVHGSDEILLQCIRYLHGAPLELNFENVEVIVKFASWYGVSALFSCCVDWFKTEIPRSESVQATLKGIMKLLKISNCLPYSDSAVLKDLAHKLVWVHRSEKFWTEMVHHVDFWITGFDIIQIVKNSPETHGRSIVVKWTSLSMDNKNFVLSNHASLDFYALFPNEEDFSSFISLIMSDEISMSSKKVKTLLDVHKEYYKRRTESLLHGQSSVQQINNSRLLDDLKSSNSSVDESASYAKGAVEDIMSGTTEQRGKFQTVDSKTVDGVSFPFCQDKSYLEVRNLPPGTREDDLWIVFKDKEGLESIDIIAPLYDFAILTLKDDLSVKRLIQSSYRQLTLNGNKLDLQPCSANHYDRVLYIGNIPHEFDKKELNQLLSRFGRLTEFYIPGNQLDSRCKSCYAFVNYRDFASATGLINASRHKGCFYRGNKLVIEFKKTKYYRDHQKGKLYRHIVATELPKGKDYCELARQS